MEQNDLSRSIAQFAKKIADYVLRRVRNEMMGDTVRFFRAQAVSDAENGKITVRRPFDSATFSLPCASPDIRAGQSCVVLVFGSASNAVALSFQ